MKTRLKLFCALSCSIIQIFILCACNFNIERLLLDERNFTGITNRRR